MVWQGDDCLTLAKGERSFKLRFFDHLVNLTQIHDLGLRKKFAEVGIFGAGDFLCQIMSFSGIAAGSAKRVTGKRCRNKMLIDLYH